MWEFYTQLLIFEHKMRQFVIFNHVKVAVPVLLRRRGSGTFVLPDDEDGVTLSSIWGGQLCEHGHGYSMTAAKTLIC